MSEEQDIQNVEREVDSYKSNVSTVFKATLNWDRDFIFVGRTQRGYEIEFDANVQWGAQPSEPFMMSLGACTATDCVMFLQKMKVEIVAFKVDITGVKAETPPQYFKGFDIMLNITAKNISEKKVQRAINLSVDKYCGIYHSLRKDVKLDIKYQINNVE